MKLFYPDSYQGKTGVEMYGLCNIRDAIISIANRVYVKMPSEANEIIYYATMICKYCPYRDNCAK